MDRHANDGFGSCHRADFNVVGVGGRQSIESNGLIYNHGDLDGKNKLGSTTKCKLASAEFSGPTMDHYAVGYADPELDEIDTRFRELPYQHSFSPDTSQNRKCARFSKHAFGLQQGQEEIGLCRTT
jgi:hypothetical protein